MQSTLSWADKRPTGMCKDFVSGMNEMGKIWISDLLEKGMDPCFPVEKAEEVNHTWIYFVNMVALKGLELEKATADLQKLEIAEKKRRGSNEE